MIPSRRFGADPAGLKTSSSKLYAAHAKEVYALNEAAKSTGTRTESYSIRKNGDVWKFEKRNDGWKRVADWVFTPSASENEARTPR